MIALNETCGRKHHVAIAEIASYAEAGNSSQWHGIRSIVFLRDRRVLEVRETTEQITAMIEQERQR